MSKTGFFVGWPLPTILLYQLTQVFRHGSKGLISSGTNCVRNANKALSYGFGCCKHTETHIYLANAIVLKKPIALGVLHTDLQTLKTNFPSPELWKESKLIKYEDALTIVVDCHREKGEVDTLFLQVGGKLTITELNQKHDVSGDVESQRTLQNLFYRNGCFHFNELTSEPVLQPNDYYITAYEPLNGHAGRKPDIEYVTEDEIKSYLNDTISIVLYESQLTNAKILKTYFPLRNGVKVNVWYDKESRIAIFKATFNVLTTTDEQDLVKMNVPINTLSFNLDSPLTLPLSALGKVHGVSVIPPPQSTTENITGLLKLKRKHVIQDMLQSSPPYTTKRSKIVGATVYDKHKVTTLAYTDTNQKTMRRLAGKFRTSDGIPFQWLCLATPDDTPDKKNVDWYRSSNDFSEKPVLFPCESENTDIALIVLKEDDDFIEMMDGAIKELDLMAPDSQIGPFLEYVSYGKFLKTLQVVSHVMKMKCSIENRYSHRSYQLFVDVFLIYDCKTRLVRFDDLNLWLGFDKHTSALSEKVSSVTFNSNTNQFQQVDGTITNFKVRQLRNVISKRFPIDLQYENKCGAPSIGIDLESVEWDLYDIYKNLKDRPLNILPASGIVYLDGDQMLVAKMSEDTMGGRKKRFVVSQGTGLFDTCTQSSCRQEKEIIYDGSKMYSRKSSQSAPREVKANVFSPIIPCRSSAWDKALAKYFFYKQSYMTLSSFLSDVRGLAWNIRKKCGERKNDPVHDRRFYFYMYFFKNEDPAIGYYDCTLQYMFFASDFKVVKYPKSEKKPPSESLMKVLQMESGLSSGIFSTLLSEYSDEATINGSSDGSFSEEIQARRKYSNYILQDLVYDHTGHRLHSRSMVLPNVVYALRPLRLFNNKNTKNRTLGMKDVVFLDSGCIATVYK